MLNVPYTNYFLSRFAGMLLAVLVHVLTFAVLILRRYKNFWQCSYHMFVVLLKWRRLKLPASMLEAEVG